MSAAKSADTELRHGAEQTVVTEAFAACFAAAATSFFGSEDGVDAVRALMDSAPRVWDVLARFVVGRTEPISEDLRGFVAGWCVACVQISTPPGVTENAVRSACARRFGMDERGRRMRNQAIRLGLVGVNGPALRWYGTGWMYAVSHSHNCAEADAEDADDEHDLVAPASAFGGGDDAAVRGGRPPPGTPWQRIDWYSIDLGTPGMDVGLCVNVAIERIGVMTDAGPVYTKQRMRQLRVAKAVECEIEPADRDHDELTSFRRFDIVAVEHLEAVEGPAAVGQSGGDGGSEKCPPAAASASPDTSLARADER